ncbi:MAG: hypothetical protein JO052_29650 [Bradyrhizobium sp.]|nr:hypothetical protein [Bradyrhizobium sp.]
MSSLEGTRVRDDDGLLSSLRYLFADFLDEQDTTPPRLPDGLPDSLSSIVDDGISLLMDYQGAAYARLYVERLQRFTGRIDVTPAMLAEIARLLASRMAYQDAIRIAQLKLAQLNQTGVRSVENVRLRFDELVDTLPAVAADPVLTVLGYLGWLHKQVSIPFSTASLWGIRRLKMEAWLRRWRMFSIRYAEERVWVERWLHMIARCLAKQPQSVSAVIQTATMVQGYGDAYRQGLADWHAIIDALAKPTFDGALPLGDLAGAIVEARAAAMPDPRQASLKRSIAQIRARAMGGAVNAAA